MPGGNEFKEEKEVLETELRSWDFILKGNEWKDLLIFFGEGFRINNVMLTMSTFLFF